MVWLPMRQLSTKDQNDTDINNYRSPYGLQQWTKPIVCLFCSHIDPNIMEFNAIVIQVRGLLGIKPGLIHHCLHKKMSVPNQKYDSCYPFVWCFWAFYFAVDYRRSVLNFPRSSFFCLLFTVHTLSLFTRPRSFWTWISFIFL